jgi:hypothetical protein
MPISEHSSGWLTELIQEATANNWCMRPYCTLCGASNFRSEIFKRAYEGVGDDELDWANLRDAMLSISPSIEAAMVREIAEELASITDIYRFPTSCLRVLLIDLNNLCSPLVGTLDEMLEGSEAGEYLSKMRAHSEARYKNWNKEEPVDPQVEKEREQQRRQKEIRYNECVNTVRRPQRVRIFDGTTPIHEFLKEYCNLSPAEQLKKLAAADLQFSFDVIPRDYIPVEEEITALSLEERQLLKSRIDKRTKGWNRISNRLSSAE